MPLTGNSYTIASDCCKIARMRPYNSATFYTYSVNIRNIHFNSFTKIKLTLMDTNSTISGFLMISEEIKDPETSQQSEENNYVEHLDYSFFPDTSF
jgi:hypothetical protein